MPTYEIAPGSILQRMYLKSRLRKLQMQGKRFIEVGAGTGYNSRILLEEGMKGIGFDLNAESCELNKQMNELYIGKELYSVSNQNFFDLGIDSKFDLIISCMVIEHLSDEDVVKYFAKCKSLLHTNGVIITLVPSSMKYWGIEDEIAGHFKRYSFDCFRKIASKSSLKIHHIAGLTFPLSNILFSLSNYLVKKAEGHKASLTMEDRTVKSSNRKVLFKTDYPFYFKLLLNEITLWPFYLLQILNSKNPDSMVIYAEIKQ